MNRRNQILGALLVAQLVLAVVVFWPRSTVSGAEAGPIFADFKADDVVSMSITDAEGNQVVLAKDGDSWVLPGADDYPADGEKITSLLQKIEKIQADRQVTRTESSHRRLQVAADDFVRRIDLELSGGQTYKLYVGSSPQSSATHVRADGNPETYLTGDLVSYDVNARSAGWIDTLYYTLPQTTTVALTLKNPNGEFDFTRDAEGQWTLQALAEGEVFNEAAFSSLLSQATSLRMVEPIGREAQAAFKLDAPQAVITVQTDDGQSYTLQIGALREEDNSYVAKWSESPYYVYAAQYTGESFVNKTREDFIQPPATPTPGAEPIPGEDASPDGG
jgi:hypothetical protein